MNTYLIIFLFCVGLLSCVHAFRLSDMHSLSVLIKCQTGLRVAPGKHSNKCYQAREKTATSTRHILTIPENMFPCSPLHVFREQATCNQTPENMLPSTRKHLTKHMNKLIPSIRKHVSEHPNACYPEQNVTKHQNTC